MVDSSLSPELDVLVTVSAGMLTVPDPVAAVAATPGLENEPDASRRQVRKC